MKQNTEEWLEYRRDKIGSSDAPVIMEISPWKTPYQLWEYKVGITSETKETEAMRRGKELEEKAREEFMNRCGIFVEPIVRANIDRPWQIASVDGYNESQNIAVEIKVPGRKDHSKAIDGEIPIKYLPQLYHIIDVCSLDFIYYFSYNESDSKLLRLDRDQDMINELVIKESAFYERMVNFDPPPLLERDYHLRDDDQWTEKAKEWVEINAQLKALKKKEDSVRQEIIKMACSVSTQGSGVRARKNYRAGTVDYNKIPELKGVNLDCYRKAPIEVWTIESIKERSKCHPTV